MSASRLVPAIRAVTFIALRQLWDRKLLNGIAVSGVALGVLVLITMSGIIFGLREKFLQTMMKVTPHVTIRDVEIRPEPPLLERYYEGYVAAEVAHDVPRDRDARIERPNEIVAALSSLSLVEAAAPTLSGNAMLEFAGKTGSVEIRGIEPERAEQVTPMGPFVRVGDFDALAVAVDGIIVGSGVAEDLGLEVDNLVRAAAPAGTPMNLKVLAIFETGVTQVDDTRAYVLLRNAQVLLGRPDTVGQIEIRLRNPDDAMWMYERVEHLFGYEAVSWQEQNSSFLAVFEQQDMIFSFVIGSILVVGGFGILAIQIMIVLQKTRDIAILRSVGLRRADILRIFLAQGVAIALTGAGVGAALGKLALTRLATMKAQNPMLKTETFLIVDDPRFYLQGVAFALIVGVLASLLPAWRGSRVEPVDVLRGQIG